MLISSELELVVSSVDPDRMLPFNGAAGNMAISGQVDAFFPFKFIIR